MKQTRLISIIEICLNVASGFILAMLVWGLLIPVIFPHHAGPLYENFIITLTFTVVSVLRGYFWRRFFNNGVHATVANWVGKLWSGSERLPECEPYHLAAALGDKPCKVCGADSWMSKYRRAGGKIS